MSPGLARLAITAVADDFIGCEVGVRTAVKHVGENPVAAFEEVAASIAPQRIGAVVGAAQVFDRDVAVARRVAGVVGGVAQVRSHGGGGTGILSRITAAAAIENVRAGVSAKIVVVAVADQACR